MPDLGMAEYASSRPSVPVPPLASTTQTTALPAVVPSLVTNGDPDEYPKCSGAGAGRRQPGYAAAVQSVAEGTEDAAATLEYIDPAALAPVGGGVAPDASEGTQGLENCVSMVGALFESPHVIRVDQEDPAVLAHLDQEMGVRFGAELGGGQGHGTTGAQVLVVARRDWRRCSARRTGWE